MSKPVQRILKKDIPSASNPDMKSNGIYYWPDQADVMKGLALIIGPPKTPYEGGYWFFSVDFNSQHPFEPPKVLTLTQDGKTRFNPNMYKEGKVCLSLLGTWHQGDKWTSVQTLGSVLLSILGMVLTEQPLRNEPCYADHKTHPHFDPYNRLVFHASIETMLRFLDSPPSYIPADHKDEIWLLMKRQFLKNVDGLIARCSELGPEYDGKIESVSFFGMTTKYYWYILRDKLIAKKTELEASVPAEEVAAALDEMEL